MKGHPRGHDGIMGFFGKSQGFEEPYSRCMHLPSPFVNDSLLRYGLPVSRPVSQLNRDAARPLDVVCRGDKVGQKDVHSGYAQECSDHGR